MTVKKKRTMILSAILIALFIFTIWTIWSNSALELNSYTLTNSKLREAFNGFRIAQVSDLHNTEIGTDNNDLVEMLTFAKPDIIAMTGDIIDSNNTDLDIALHFAEEAVKIAPCYYITGNHEAWVSENIYSEFEDNLIEMGISVLHNEKVLLEREEAKISLIGIDDPDFFERATLGGIQGAIIETKLSPLLDNRNYNIVLCHRPEFFDNYAALGAELVLTGHAHGGQFRLPFIGGLIAPNQGLFPQYDAGLFSEKNTNMIVSRGVGNSIIPFRFHNRPEVILIELQADTSN